jgi:putative flippase GtrA
MENSSPAPAPQSIGSQRDYLFGLAAGFVIGLLLLPILSAVKHDLYLSLRFVLIPLFLVLVPLGLVIASWISRRLTFVWQLAKFVVIGGMNTLVDLGALAFISAIAIKPDTPWFTIFGQVVAYYTLYKAISFILANLNSYIWNKYWTFQKDSTEKTGSEFTAFFAVSIIGFVINLSVASSIFALPALGGLDLKQWGTAAAAIGSIVGLAWNFLGYKFFVFKK